MSKPRSLDIMHILQSSHFVQVAFKSPILRADKIDPRPACDLLRVYSSNRNRLRCVAFYLPCFDPCDTRQLQCPPQSLFARSMIEFNHDSCTKAAGETWCSLLLHTPYPLHVRFFATGSIFHGSPYRITSKNPGLYSPAPTSCTLTYCRISCLRLTCKDTRQLP